MMDIDNDYCEIVICVRSYDRTKEHANALLRLVKPVTKETNDNVFLQLRANKGNTEQRGIKHTQPHLY